MKSIPKLIRRSVKILVFSFILLMALNIALFAALTFHYVSNGQPWSVADEVAKKLQKTDSGYFLPESVSAELARQHVWAVFIDNDTLQTVWQTEYLPACVPSSYTASDIASLTRGYIGGYPAFTGTSENGLAVLGYPKKSFWKHMWPSWDYQMIESLPKTVLAVLAINAAIIFLIYVTANSRLLASIKPITNGIHSLPTGQPVHVMEKGVLSELAANINQTSEILQSQNYQLRKKETARANWIAGVSHDIRTPLSMVMGYAEQLKDSAHLTEEEQRKASVIVKQSERIRDLVSDLNLASKMEYNMQPVHLKKENMTAIVRQAVVDFINLDIEGRYPIEWETEESLCICPVNADKDLIKRAVSNLIQNCISHNEQGCRIFVNVTASGSECCIEVADDGQGLSDSQIERLNHTPHYMVCDENTDGQRHGLGLLIVKQIAQSHGGTFWTGHSAQGGFSAKISVPVSL